VKHQVSTQREAIAYLTSKVQSADINRRAADSGQAGNLIDIRSWHQSTLPAAGYINQQASLADFHG